MAGNTGLTENSIKILETDKALKGQKQERIYF